jgi:hypothetical protein
MLLCDAGSRWITLDEKVELFMSDEMGRILKKNILA